MTEKERLAKIGRADRRRTIMFFVKTAIVFIALFMFTDVTNERFHLDLHWYAYGAILGFIYIIIKGLTDIGT